MVFLIRRNPPPIQQLSLRLFPKFQSYGRVKRYGNIDVESGLLALQAYGFALFFENFA